ncbi:ABC transporter permease [Leptolyngbya sp. BC1307]|uniref:ABC transporter permease n=1 Tax=Leptolyngbya sp. BC1307 TaxID=2029589 RepID=UPI000EFC20AC|nr:ABC transporter permease [Leptolyngbya sp. BC1307]
MSSPTRQLSPLTRAALTLRDFTTSETTLYIIKRLIQALITLLLATVFSFLVVQLAPGDFLTPYRQNPDISPETLAALEQQYRLDQPVWDQYLAWLQQVVTKFNFGMSFAYQRPALEILWERVPNTILLSAASLFVTWAIAIPLGIVSAVHQNRWPDRFLRVFSYIGQGFPTIITGLLLLFFAQLTAPLFPVGGRTSLYHEDLNFIGKILDVAWHLILPTLALSITSFAGLQRLMRGQLLDVLRQDYIQTARAKGLPENKVIYVHALRNAINPLITILGFEFAALLSGSFIVENYFSWPGLGKLTLEAVQAQDLYLIMASLVLGAVMLIVGNLLADLALSFVDPRIKLSRLN